jgi:hypothetical protein
LSSRPVFDPTPPATFNAPTDDHGDFPVLAYSSMDYQNWSSHVHLFTLKIKKSSDLD